MEKSYDEQKDYRVKALQTAVLLNPCNTMDRTENNPTADKVLADAEKIYKWLEKEE